MHHVGGQTCSSTKAKSGQAVIIGETLTTSPICVGLMTRMAERTLRVASVLRIEEFDARDREAVAPFL